MDIRGMAQRSFIVFAGSIVYSVGIGLLLDPNGLAPGGMIGIAMILSRVLSRAGIGMLGTGILYFVLNIPIMILGVIKLGIRFMASSFLVVVLNSVVIDSLSHYGAVTNDRLLAAVVGGALVGIGLGLIFLAGTTSGGMDIIIKLIKKKHPHMKTGFLFMAIDLSIVALTGIVFRDFDLAMYAAIAVFVSGRAMNYVLYGSDEARLIFIISKENVSIAHLILESLEAGVTFLHGNGAYTGEDKNVIMCVVRRNVVPKLQEIVKSADERSFMIITSANEIYGEGYKNIIESGKL